VWGEGQNYSYYLDTFITVRVKNGDKKRKRGKKGGIGGKQRRIEKKGLLHTYGMCFSIILLTKSDVPPATL